MGMIMASRHKLVFPDGLVQDLETPPNVDVGDLLPSAHIGATPEPAGKYMITRIETSDPGEYPHDTYYYLERF